MMIYAIAYTIVFSHPALRSLDATTNRVGGNRSIFSQMATGPGVAAHEAGHMAGPIDRPAPDLGPPGPARFGTRMLRRYDDHRPFVRPPARSRATRYAQRLAMTFTNEGALSTLGNSSARASRTPSICG